MLLYKNIINRLIKKNISTSVVESCTGGLISSLIVSHKGVSKIFHFGIITYSNKSKSNLLNISPKDLKKNGAVSHQIAKLMVINLYKISKCKLCISTTGIAGPKGGTKNKPIGLVFIGIKFKNKTIILKNNFKGSRKKIQNQTVKSLFETLNKLI